MESVVAYCVWRLLTGKFDKPGMKSVILGNMVLLEDPNVSFPH